MFAPPGYITFQELCWRFHDALDEVFPDSEIKRSIWFALGAKDEAEAKRLGITDADFERAWNPIFAFPVWACWFLCGSEQLPTYLSSEDGRVVRITPRFFQFMPGSLAEIERIKLPVMKGDHLQSFLEDYKNGGADASRFVVRDDCITVSLETGCVRSYPNMARLAAKAAELKTKARRARNLEFRAMLMELVPAGKDVAFDADALPAEAMDSLPDEFWRSASRFAGWSLCFSRTDIPQSVQELLALVPFEVNFTDDGERTGDPSNRDSPTALIERIVRMWDEGEVVVRDEIRRSLASQMKTEAWRAVWRAATDLRPDLSRRGPKRSRRNLFINSQNHSERF